MLILIIAYKYYIDKSNNLCYNIKTLFILQCLRKEVQYAEWKNLKNEARIHIASWERPLREGYRGEVQSQPCDSI